MTLHDKSSGGVVMSMNPAVTGVAKHGVWVFALHLHTRLGAACDAALVDIDQDQYSTNQTDDEKDLNTQLSLDDIFEMQTF